MFDEQTQKERMMTNASELELGIQMEMLSQLYGNRFEDAMNELYSSKNIKQTAKKIIELEKELGPFTVGKFNKYLLPRDFVWPTVGGKQTDAAMFERDFMRIPENLRQRLSDVIRANLHSPNPLPMFYRTTTNVDKSHDIIVKPFVYNGVLYLGILYLCSNPKTPT
jgi:hypothetical protein